MNAYTPADHIKNSVAKLQVAIKLCHCFQYFRYDKLVMRNLYSSQKEIWSTTELKIKNLLKTLKINSEKQFLC